MESALGRVAKAAAMFAEILRAKSITRCGLRRALLALIEEASAACGGKRWERIAGRGGARGKGWGVGARRGMFALREQRQVVARQPLV